MGTHSAFLLRQFDYESRNNADVAQIGYTTLLKELPWTISMRSICRR